MDKLKQYKIITIVLGLMLIAMTTAFVISYPLNPSGIIYELPSGGYIYQDDYPLKYGGMAIRYNQYSFDGTLDYQITLNPLKIK